jgi:3-hydroxybutyryl-CoA dehydrogenase
MKFDQNGLVGVIGAGTMGTGVAQNLASSGFANVVLLDLTPEIGEQAKARIVRDLRFGRMFGAAAAGAPDAKTVLARIHFHTDYAALAGAAFIIENVVERWDVKQKVYKQLDAVCPPECVYAANTSAIPITKIGAATTRPDRVAGIHFMNPVPRKPAVEVIRGMHTSEATLETVKSLLALMGMEWIVVNDSPGFVTNRVLMLTINEAIFLLHEQVAAPEDVDRIFKSCFGHKMGPLETADLIGLDTILDSLVVLYESFNDPKFRPCPLLRKLVDAGYLGRKSGRGIFLYPGEAI